MPEEYLILTYLDTLFTTKTEYVTSKCTLSELSWEYDMLPTIEENFAKIIKDIETIDEIKVYDENNNIYHDFEYKEYMFQPTMNIVNYKTTIVPLSR